MANPIISDDELQEFEANDRHEALLDAIRSLAPKADEEAAKRHEELVSVLNAIAKRPVPEIEKLLSGMLSELAGIEKKRSDDVAQIVERISKGIAEMKTMLGNKPKSFSIERNNIGLIVKIIPEY